MKQTDTYTNKPKVLKPHYIIPNTVLALGRDCTFPDQFR